MKRLYIILAFLTLAFTPDLSALTISIYHTSDAHGWYSSRTASWDKENSTRSIGGFAALSSLVRQDMNPHILLDSGDTFQGTPEGNLTKGMATVRLMNQLGYSAALVGNHDFDYGEDNLKVLVSSSAFPWLGANVYVKITEKGPAYLKPYSIIAIAGKKIAVIGIAGGHTTTSTLPTLVKHLEFRSETSEAAYWTREVKRLYNPDAIVILAHIGFDGNIGPKTDISTWTFTPGDTGYGTLSVARAAQGANVVIGGHNHAGLIKGYQDNESGILIAESFWGLTDVSKIELHFNDATGKYLGAEDTLIPLWTDVTGEDPAVLQTIRDFSASVDKAMGVVLGESEADLGTSGTGLDSPIGNWMTDAMRRQAGADLAFQNTAGIRAGMKKGPVRMRDLYQVMPFENTLVKLKMTGRQVQKLIEDNLRATYSKMQISGLLVKYKLSPDGKLAGLILERDGKALSPVAEFTVVTNNYLAGGGTGGAAFKEGTGRTDTLLPIRDLLIKDIRANSPITLPAGGRFVKLD
jgi:2',3'-cyclic-nucleotide 2'-phosphodiesterase/3'-nucleotidase